MKKESAHCLEQKEKMLFVRPGNAKMQGLFHPIKKRNNFSENRAILLQPSNINANQRSGKLILIGRSTPSIQKPYGWIGESKLIWVNRRTVINKQALKYYNNASICGMDALAESESPSTALSSRRRMSNPLALHPTVQGWNNQNLKRQN